MPFSGSWGCAVCRRRNLNRSAKGESARGRTTRSCRIMMRVRGTWRTATGRRRSICWRERQRVHSWLEREAWDTAHQLHQRTHCPYPTEASHTTVSSTGRRVGTDLRLPSTSTSRSKRWSCTIRRTPWRSTTTSWRPLWCVRSMLWNVISSRVPNNNSWSVPIRNILAEGVDGLSWEAGGHTGR